MEKMNTESANRIFEEVNNGWDNFWTVKYGTKELPIKFFYNISMIDLETIISIVSGALVLEDEYKPIKMRSILATCIIKYFTDLPVPTLAISDPESETETKDIDDYITCYELIYGVNGIANSNENINLIITEIECLIEDAVFSELEKNDPVYKLASKILQLGKEFGLAVDEQLSNPDSELNRALSRAAENMMGSAS